MNLVGQSYASLFRVLFPLAGLTAVPTGLLSGPSLLWCGSV